MATMSRLSTEYIWHRITTVQDLTGSSVAVAFMPDPPAGLPTQADWNAGELVQEGTQWWARVLVGPEGIVLTPGTYQTWVRITDMPEIPVRNSGTVTIT
jgi:hypothetical protein